MDFVTLDLALRRHDRATIADALAEQLDHRLSVAAGDVKLPGDPQE